MTENSAWLPVWMVPENVFVMTKIHDDGGCRNEQIMRRQGKLWFCRDGSYVYYVPTHFRSLTVSEKMEIVNQRKTAIQTLESNLFKHLG